MAWKGWPWCAAPSWAIARALKIAARPAELSAGLHAGVDVKNPVQAPGRGDQAGRGLRLAARGEGPCRLRAQRGLRCGRRCCRGCLGGSLLRGGAFFTASLLWRVPQPSLRRRGGFLGHYGLLGGRCGFLGRRSDPSKPTGSLQPLRPSWRVLRLSWPRARCEQGLGQAAGACLRPSWPVLRPSSEQRFLAGPSHYGLLGCWFS